MVDIENPKEILVKSYYLLFDPDLEWEKTGIVPNVVFSCGSVVIGDEIIIFYGGADKVIECARIYLSEILEGCLCLGLDMKGL